MSRLDQLPEITDQVLSGLRADDSLKYRIYQKASGLSENEGRKPSRLPLAALCAISAVMIAAFILLVPFSRQSSLPGGRQVSSDHYESVDINHIPAGTVLPESPLKDHDENAASPEDEETADPQKGASDDASQEGTSDAPAETDSEMNQQDQD